MKDSIFLAPFKVHDLVTGVLALTQLKSESCGSAFAKYDLICFKQFLDCLTPTLDLYFPALPDTTGVSLSSFPHPYFLLQLLNP